MGLPCVNCGEEIQPDDAKIFAKVLVCSACNTLAERMLERGERTISLLKSLLELSIRQAIIDKKLQFHARSLDDETAAYEDEDFLKVLMKMVQDVRMAEFQEKRGCLPPTSTPSKETTKPRVSIADGKPESD